MNPVRTQRHATGTSARGEHRGAGEVGVFIHPTALCESSTVGDGTRIWAFAHVMEGAVVGRQCNLCDHVYVEGGARLGDRVIVKNRSLVWDGVDIEDDVIVGPGVVFTNDRYPRNRNLVYVAQRYASPDNWLLSTRVRRGATIGAGAVILPGLSIGEFAVVAAGAVVTRDVPAHRLAMGNPTKLGDWVCFCGVPLNADQACRCCGTRFSVEEERLKVESPGTQPAAAY